MTSNGEMGVSTPESQLQCYLERLDPTIRERIQSVRAAVRKRFPTANELAYDYTSFVVIAYSPTDRGIDGIFTLAARATGVFLYFSQGPQLPDPKRMLQGKGKQTRFIALESAGQLEHPDVEALIAATLGQAKLAFSSEGEGALIIKTDSTKKRLRRSPGK